MAKNDSAISEFYLACRSNDINKVKSLIRTLTLDEINRIEPNGSTALHVAAYHGHHEIVQLLLDRGAFRSIRNRYGNTPQAESRTNEIKQLFLRKNGTERYVCHSGDIQWMKVDENVHREAEKWRWLIKHSWEGRSLDWLVHEIQTDFIDSDFQQSTDLELIKNFFLQAVTRADAVYVIKAYTAETDFYKNLNKQLAIIGGNFKSKTNHANRCGMKCYLQIFFTHRDFDGMSYIGESYRGMQVFKHDLDQYEVGSQIMNKSFLSTSFDYQVARHFALSNADQNKEKHTALCTYKIKAKRTALRIMDISEYPEEKEVLIMPYTAFQVISIQRSSGQENDQPDFLIELEECITTNEQEVTETQAKTNEKPLSFRKRLMKRLTKWLESDK